LESQNKKHLDKGVDPVAAEKLLKSKNMFSRKTLYKSGMMNLLVQAIGARVSNAGILCFSAVGNSVLMWSHYAEEHKGICLIFDTSKDLGILAERIWKVHYSSRYPYQNIFSLNPDRKFRTLLTTKSKVWKYEKEYRFLREPGGRTFSFEPAALIGVIFGCKTPPTESEQVKTLLSARVKTVAFYRAVKTKSTYSLDIVREK
jgi:hypothetical protein